MNTQTPEKPIQNQHGFIEVHSIFETIQGEGPHAGTPAVFVRLAGCNLGGHTCAQCDTDYTSIRRHATVKDIANDVESLRKNTLVVITGGEPFRQSGLAELVAALLSYNPCVEIETNGTLYQELPFVGRGRCSIVCSPKTATVSKLIWTQINALKYVVQAGCTDEKDGLPTRVLGVDCRVARPPSWFNGTIFIQPCDENDPAKNKANMDEAVRAVMRHGYRLSLQMHKIVGLD